MKRSTGLPTFVQPFVTRSLRGGRGRRYVLLSFAFALLSVALGLVLALGSGHLAQDVRVSLGLEDSEMERELTSYTVFAHSDREQAALERVAGELRREIADELGEDPTARSYTELSETTPVLMAAVRSVWSRTQPGTRVERLMHRKFMLDPQLSRSEGYYPVWLDPDSPEDKHSFLLAASRGGVPAVERYRSQLGARGCFVLIGLVLGLALTTLATVVAPLLVAAQQAQERHENTLQPLTATTLRPSELAVGLASGPLSVVAIFAAPLVLGYLAAVVVAGELGLGLTFAVLLAAFGFALTAGAQLLGQLLGKRRAPGALGVALTTGLLLLWLFSAMATHPLAHGEVWLAAFVPHAGAHMALFGTFGVATAATAATAELIAVAAVTVVAALTLGTLMVVATGRRLEGLGRPTLERWPARIGAMTVLGLVHIPFIQSVPGTLVPFAAALVAGVPLALLLAARLPADCEPSQLARVSLAGLLAEFAGWLAVHLALSSAMLCFTVGTTGLAFWRDPLSLAALVWCALTVALLGLRVALVPRGILRHLWSGVLALCLLLGVIQMMYTAGGNAASLVLTQLDPALGLLQLGLAVAIPLSLIHSLRKTLRNARSSK